MQLKDHVLLELLGYFEWCFGVDKICLESAIWSLDD